MHVKIQSSGQIFNSNINLVTCVLFLCIAHLETWIRLIVTVGKSEWGEKCLKPLLALAFN